MQENNVAAALQAIRAGAIPRDLETQQLEFKVEDRDLKKTLETIADTVICLANTEGGALVIGVADRPDAAGNSIPGVSPDLTVDAVRRGIFQRTRPSLSVPVAELEEGGRRLLVVTVPQGVVFYANARGTATRRVGSDCMPFPPEEQRQAAAARGQIDWSEELTDVGIESASADELARFRRLLALAGRDDLARADDRKLIRDLRLSDAGGRLTRAGVLLLGREQDIERWIPTYGYAYQYRETPGSESTARMRGRRPILAAVDLLLEAVAVRSRVHPINLAGGVQLQIHDYPRDAVRELVVNGFVHRDYEQGGAVEIEHSPEWLSVTSPGGLVFGVTPDNILTHPSTPRHRLLLETVTALQVAERTGQGIDRAYRELLRSGKTPPEINDDGMQVRVLVPGGTGNDAFARFVAELPPEQGQDVDVLLALSSLRDHRSIDASTLAPRTQRSPTEAQGALDRLAAVGLIEPTKRTARKSFPTYNLTSQALASLGRAVRYHWRQQGDVDRKIVEHVREYGHITNQTLRRLFNMDVFAARDLLRDLQQRKVLAKIDPARGGPGIRYGPGDQFPRDAGDARQRR